MKTIVYADLERLTPLPIGKTAWIEDGKRRWEITSETFRFLLIREEEPILIIGPIKSHIELLLVHEARSLPIEQAGNIILYTDRNKITGQNILAAGSVDYAGRITSWESIGFNITIPDELRPEIERIITELFASGELTVDLATT
jgi:hypothetical protein